jgi:hypothetical protein
MTFLFVIALLLATGQGLAASALVLHPIRDYRVEIGMLA